MNAHTIQATLDNGLCIGCGFCVAVCPAGCLSMAWGEKRAWEVVPDVDACTECGQCLAVCPNSVRSLEAAADRVTTTGCEALGCPEGQAPVCFTSYRTDHSQRMRSASGGTSTALLETLLAGKRVDAVLATRPRMAASGEPHFEVALCRTVEELRHTQSSAYGPVRYDEVLRELAASGETCAATVLPCVQRAIDNLPSALRRLFRYTIGIACSHNVSDLFADYLAKRHGIPAGRRFILNYRDKTGAPDANRFRTCFHFEDGTALRTPRMTNGFTVCWRGYWFAREACLYCPDFFATGADMMVKDAWGPRSSDPGGTTLCVVRDPELESALRHLAGTGRLHLESISAEDVLASQADTATDKEVGFRQRWHEHPALRNWVLRDQPGFQADSDAVRNYRSRLRRLRLTDRLFRNGNRGGFLLLRSWEALCGGTQRARRGLASCRHRVGGLLRAVVERVRRVGGVAARLLGLRQPYQWRDPRTEGRRGAPPPSLRVLVVGGFGYRNVGDEAQLGANLGRWRELVPDCHLTVLSPYPGYTAHEHGVESDWAPRVVWFDSNRSNSYRRSTPAFEKRFWRLRRRLVWTARFLRAGLRLQFCTPAEARVLDHIQRADLLHVSGGGFLTGMTRSRLWENMLLLRLCQILGTPVILTGQTIGVFQSRHDRKLAKWGLSAASYIGLRDQGDSENELAANGICGPHVHSGFDDALFCDRASPDAVRSCLESAGTDVSHGYLVANFHFWGMAAPTREQATQRFAELCDRMVRATGLPMLFVPMVPRDEEAETEVITRMKEAARLVSHGYDYRVVRTVLAGSRCVLTMKHHPIIFAHGEGVPCLSIALDPYYLRKNRGAMSHAGHERFVLDKEEFLGGKAPAMVGEFVAQLDTLRHELERFVGVARNRARAAFVAAVSGAGLKCDR